MWHSHWLLIDHIHTDEDVYPCQVEISLSLTRSEVYRGCWQIEAREWLFTLLAAGDLAEEDDEMVVCDVDVGKE